MNGGYETRVVNHSASHHKILSPGMVDHDRRGTLLGLQEEAWSDACQRSLPNEAGLFRWVVVQVLPEPSLNLSDAHPFAFAVVGDLITVNLAEAEISRFRVGEVESTHA